MNQQEAFNAKVAALGESLVTALKAELPEIIAAVIAKTPAGQPLDLSPLDKLGDKLLAAIGAQSDQVGTPPAEGRHNVSLTLHTDNTAAGGELFTIPAVNNNVSEGRAALLRGIYDAMKAAAAEQAPGGGSFTSEVSFSDNEVSDGFTTSTGKQKAAADAVLLRALLEEAEAQLAAPDAE